MIVHFFVILLGVVGLFSALGFIAYEALVEVEKCNRLRNEIRQLREDNDKLAKEIRSR